MTQETLIVVFDMQDQARSAVTELVREKVLPHDIECHAQAALAASTRATATSGSAVDFWSYLFGGETTSEQNTVYERTVRSGGEVMTVLLRDVERDADHVMMILEKHSPVDVAERAASYDLASPSEASISEQILQLSEEQLAVGKREVSRGATRLRRFVQTKAVEQNVALHDVTVVVERRAAAIDAIVGPDAFVDGVIEMTETREEAVVFKRARVREEVVLQKAITQRIETIHENLRSEQVEVEQVPAASRPNIRP